MASTASPLQGTQLHGLAARGGRGPCVVEGLVRGFGADDPETAEDRSDVGDRAVRDQRVLGVLSRGVNGTCRLGWCQAAHLDETPRGLEVLVERRHGGHGPLHVSGRAVDGSGVLHTGLVVDGQHVVGHGWSSWGSCQGFVSGRR